MFNTATYCKILRDLIQELPRNLTFALGQINEGLNTQAEQTQLITLVAPENPIDELEYVSEVKTSAVNERDLTELNLDLRFISSELVDSLKIKNESQFLASYKDFLAISQRLIKLPRSEMKTINVITTSLETAFTTFSDSSKQKLRSMIAEHNIKMTVVLQELEKLKKEQFKAEKEKAEKEQAEKVQAEKDERDAKTDDDLWVQQGGYSRLSK